MLQTDELQRIHLAFFDIWSVFLNENHSLPRIFPQRGCRLIIAKGLSIDHCTDDRRV